MVLICYLTAILASNFGPRSNQQNLLKIIFRLAELFPQYFGDTFIYEFLLHQPQQQEKQEKIKPRKTRSKQLRGLKLFILNKK